MPQKGINIIRFHRGNFETVEWQVIVGRVQLAHLVRTGNLTRHDPGIHIPYFCFFFKDTGFAGLYDIGTAFVQIFVAHLMNITQECLCGFAKGCQEKAATLGVSLVTVGDDLKEFVVKHLPRGEFLRTKVFRVVKKALSQAFVATGKLDRLIKGRK